MTSNSNSPKEGGYQNTRMLRKRARAVWDIVYVYVHTQKKRRTQPWKD